MRGKDEKILQEGREEKSKEETKVKRDKKK